jgi:hypothetical protein
MLGMRVHLVVLAGVGVACSPYGGGAFVCAGDGECSSGAVQGRCEPSGYCSFADGECASGQRYGSSAGDLAGQCVETAGADGQLADATSDADPALDGESADASLPFCGPGHTGLVGCWRFEANLLDESGNANHAAPTTETYGAGVDGMAVQLIATTEPDVAESASLDVTAITIEMWINPDSIPTVDRAMLFDNNGQYGFWIEPGGALRCVAGGNVTGGAVAAGIWTHVACTADATTTAVWVNGAQVAASGGAILPTAAIDGSSIGANVPTGNAFLGRIDSLRVWNVVRAPAP